MPSSPIIPPTYHTQLEVVVKVLENPIFKKETMISKNLRQNPFKLTNLLSIPHPLARKAKGK
jgi:hypothetical protein